jgi:dTDP-4-dehydrorhamnose reductase
MRILITGADGMVARAAVALCRSAGDTVSALNRRDLNITNRAAVSALMKRGEFSAVINCAAYTDVDGAESDPEGCFAVNAVGVSNLASASADTGSSFVTISTDYVFDGEKDGFYTQDDAPNPLGFYARSKLEGERLAEAANPKSIIVRTGWIFGSGGTNFLSVMHKLLGAGKEITAISDSFGTPTYAVDLAGRLREFATMAEPGIYHVVNSGPGASYFEFAQAVCRKGGFDPELVRPVSDDDLKRPAPRPRNSRLACLCSEERRFDPLPDWEDAVERFLNKEKGVVTLS